MHSGDWITLVGVIIAAIGLPVAVHGISRSNRNSSAATFIALHEAIRQAWGRLADASVEKDDAAKEHQFADLANLIEIGCALCMKSIFVGVSNELLTKHLIHTFIHINESTYAKEKLEKLIETPDTFEYMVKFIEANKINKLF